LPVTGLEDCRHTKTTHWETRNARKLRTFPDDNVPTGLLIGALAALAIVIAIGRLANARAGWGALAPMAVIFISPLCARK
jgi:hypothetical protein